MEELNEHTVGDLIHQWACSISRGSTNFGRNLLSPWCPEDNKDSMLLWNTVNYLPDCTAFSRNATVSIVSIFHLEVNAK
jgi:hypothetical protein